MRIIIQETAHKTVTLEGTQDEIQRVVENLNLKQPQGHVEREIIDARTGRRGIDTAGFGFIAGTYFDSYGDVQFSRPEDNPLHGWR